MDVVIEYNDTYHHPQTEQLRLLTLEPRVVLTAGRREGEGGREGEGAEGRGEGERGGGEGERGRGREGGEDGEGVTDRKGSDLSSTSPIFCACSYSRVLIDDSTYRGHG